MNVGYYVVVNGHIVEWLDNKAGANQIASEYRAEYPEAQVEVVKK